jgi:hypothetical protein
MDAFLRSQVFVLLDKDPGPSAVWDNSSNPMVLRNAKGQPVLAIFTDADRSTAWTGDSSKFGFGLLTDFAWLIRGIQPGVGIVVNPGLSVGMEMPASGVEALKNRASNQA